MAPPHTGQLGRWPLTTVTDQAPSEKVASLSLGDIPPGHSQHASRQPQMKRASSGQEASPMASCMLQNVLEPGDRQEGRMAGPQVSALPWLQEEGRSLTPAPRLLLC